MTDRWQHTDHHTGQPTHLAAAKQELLAAHASSTVANELDMVVIVAGGIGGTLTYDGVDVCASRVAWEVGVVQNAALISGGRGDRTAGGRGETGGCVQSGALHAVVGIATDSQTGYSLGGRECTGQDNADPESLLATFLDCCTRAHPASSHCTSPSALAPLLHR